MRQHIVSITALLIAASLLAAGEGSLHTLLALRGTLEGLSVGEIGGLTTGYYIGFLIGCLGTPRLVKRVGHIRAYASLAAVAAASALVHVLVINIALWIGMRVLFGACIAGIYMALESWLNDATSDDLRGRVFASYRIFSLGGLTIGQFLIGAFDPAGFQLFALITIFVILSLVPIALTTTRVPLAMTVVRARPLHLFAVSPAGAIGCLVVGLVGASYSSLAPLFALSAGLTTVEIAAFMAFAVIGGAVCAWPIGALSDRYDRRRVLLGLTLFSTLVGVALTLVHTWEPKALILLSFFFGASAWSVYAVAVAHANDRATADQFVEIAVGLLVLFAFGAITGPVLAVAAIAVVGDAGLFAFTACVHGAYAAILIQRLWRMDPVPDNETVPFTALPATSPVVLEMDPRAESDPEEEASDEGRLEPAEDSARKPTGETAGESPVN